eukprot:8648921-Alexandrium_andersonii.AAC.1
MPCRAREHPRSLPEGPVGPCWARERPGSTLKADRQSKAGFGNQDTSNSLHVGPQPPQPPRE